MNKSRNWHMIFNVIIAILSFLSCIILGHVLAALLFELTGKPAELVSYLISAIMGFLIFVGIAKLASEIFSRTKYGRKHNLMRHQFFDSTLEALNKISRGDFNISITINEHDPFSELAESVNKMARELSSMESQRQDFISNVSHEIQSPLTSISGFAALLKSDSLTKQQREHYIEVIETESKRLSKLSDNLLKLSALESENVPLLLRDFRLDKQIEHAILILEPQWIEKNIDIDAEFEKISIHGDEDLLGQVWINLIHNAVKFTPENGLIKIKLYKNDCQIICQITDNGVGISKEDQIHIFERFFKVDKSRDRSLGGNGLGLSLCKKIIELHNGQIIMESELSKGTKFIVTLPK
ncbi:MAG: two-component sensor histidine kinase [Oscillospiraceae bacterium]|nr:two-component sensor histidine kinase [Oscillospiraceae bacterium]